MEGCIYEENKTGNFEATCQPNHNHQLFISNIENYKQIQQLIMIIGSLEFCQFIGGQWS